MKGHIFFISGPSGVGKTTIMNALMSDTTHTFKRLLSVKTRPLRPSETDGIDYYYYTKEQFEAVKDDNNTFLEWNMYNNDYYGTLKKHAFDAINNGDIVIKEIDVNGMNTIIQQNILPKDDYTTLFLYPADTNYKAVFIERMRKSDERCSVDDDEIERRIAAMKYEFECAEWYDIWIYSENGKIEKAIEDTKDAINSVLERKSNSDEI